MKLLFKKTSLVVKIAITATFIIMLFFFLSSSPYEPQASTEEGDTHLIYFASTEVIDTGERCPYRGYVKAVNRSSIYDNEIINRLVFELIAGPMPGESGVEPVINEETRLLGVDIIDGVAYINLSEEAYKDTSRSEKSNKVFVDAVVLTVTQRPTVVKTQVFVENEPWTDGDFTWDKPIGQFEILPAS